jgi:hypothetical protein
MLIRLTAQEGYRGGKDIYQAKGNIQIFYKASGIQKLEKMEFIAKCVDKYFMK